MELKIGGTDRQTIQQYKLRECTPQHGLRASGFPMPCLGEPQSETNSVKSDQASLVTTATGKSKLNTGYRKCRYVGDKNESVGGGSGGGRPHWTLWGIPPAGPQDLL